MPQLLIYSLAVGVPIGAYLGAFAAGRLAWKRQERRLDELQRRYIERREIARARREAEDVQRTMSRSRQGTRIG